MTELKNFLPQANSNWGSRRWRSGSHHSISYRDYSDVRNEEKRGHLPILSEINGVSEISRLIQVDLIGRTTEDQSWMCSQIEGPYWLMCYGTKNKQQFELRHLHNCV